MDSTIYGMIGFSEAVVQASELLKEYQDIITPSYIQNLRKLWPHYNVEQIHAIVDIAIGTAKANQSGEYNDIMPWYFTARTFEQCSSPSICSHHMKQLQVEAEILLEICTGAGMDTIAAVKQGAHTVHTIEADSAINNFFPAALNDSQYSKNAS